MAVDFNGFNVQLVPYCNESILRERGKNKTKKRSRSEVGGNTTSQEPKPLY